MQSMLAMTGEVVRVRRTTGKTQMRRLTWIIFIVLLALPMGAQAQTEDVYALGHFVFENGGEIPDMKVGYVTWGRLSEAKDNAILLLPGTSLNRHFADSHIGPGKTYDTDKYFVVAVDPIGGGTSSSPKDGLGAAFPHYSIRDMVRAQHELITKRLGITHLVAIGGPSMGSFQTIQWGVSYPDTMTGLILIVPAARSDHHFAAIVDAAEAMVTLDPGYQGGKYAQNPTEGLRRAALIYFPWTTSDENLAMLDEAAYERAKAAAGDSWANWDANSILWRYSASREHDVSKPFGGDMMKALGQVKAKALILASMTDRTVPGYLTRELYHGLKDATYVEIPSIRGHVAGIAPPGTAEYAYISDKVKTFLAGLPR